MSKAKPNLKKINTSNKILASLQEKKTFKNNEWKYT